MQQRALPTGALLYAKQRSFNHFKLAQEIWSHTVWKESIIHDLKQAQADTKFIK